MRTPPRVAQCAKCSADSGDAQGAASWFNHLLANGASFATEQQPRGVVPDVITYNAVISAHEKAGLHEQTFALLDLATNEGRSGVGVFKRPLGFDVSRNLLDFHEPAVVMQPQSADKAYGIPPDVAKAIFRYLLSQGTINRQTTFVVGRHGEGQLKQAIQQCMIDLGWDPQHPRNELGIENAGRWVASPLKLNPFAAEFKPTR